MEKPFLITLHQQTKVFKAPEASSYQSGATSTVSTWISLSLAGCSSAEPVSVSANILGGGLGLLRFYIFKHFYQVQLLATGFLLLGCLLQFVLFYER